MYQRVEKIEEENLDWDQPKTKLNIETPKMNTNDVLPSEIESNKKVGKEVLSKSKPSFAIQKRLKRFIDKNIQIASFLGVLLLPYFIGFLVVYTLFFIYADMTITRFLSLNIESLLVEMWGIGAYFFVTLWVFWAFYQIIQYRK